MHRLHIKHCEDWTLISVRKIAWAKYHIFRQRRHSPLRQEKLPQAVLSKSSMVMKTNSPEVKWSRCAASMNWRRWSPGVKRNTTLKRYSTNIFGNVEVHIFLTSYKYITSCVFARLLKNFFVVKVGSSVEAECERTPFWRVVTQRQDETVALDTHERVVGVVHDGRVLPVEIGQKGKYENYKIHRITYFPRL